MTATLLTEPETLAATLAAWEYAQAAAGCSANTVRQRRRGLIRFAKWLAADPAADDDPRAVRLPDVQRYLARPEFTANTRSAYWRLLTAWFAFLTSSERLERSPLRGWRGPRAPRGVPRPVETGVLMRALQTADGQLQAQLMLMAYEGLRVHEVAKFRGEDISGLVLYVTGKGGVRAAVPVHPLVAGIAQFWPDRGYWFPTSSRVGHVTENWISQRTRLHFATLGAHVTPHMLRHWYVSEVLRSSGGNLRVAQELARHASVATTQIYTMVTAPERSAAVHGLPGWGSS